jgi:hypothetical protein
MTEANGGKPLTHFVVIEKDIFFNCIQQIFGVKQQLIIANTPQ